jgi:hypothetical protein
MRLFTKGILLFVSANENHIDTLFIDLFENGTLKDSRKFFDSDLKIEDYSNDSIINIAFETGNLSNGTVIAEVYANRKEIVPITSEIVFPDRLVPSTCFLMSGTGGLTYNNGTYSGTIHITRNVAKLRTLVIKNTVCIPSNLIIDYQNIKIEAQQVSDRTQLLAPPPISTPSGLNYINYAPRTGLTLRPQSSSDVNGDIYGSTLVLNKSSVTLTPLSIKTNCENINYESPPKTLNFEKSKKQVSESFLKHNL